MPKDYAKKSKTQRKSASRGRASRQRKSKPATPWIGLITGILLGLFVAGLGYLKMHPTRSHHESARHAVEHAEKSSRRIAQKVADNTTQPQFDFYRLLPRMQVAVPDPDEKRASAADTQEEPAAPMAYMLQVASFKKYQDADKLKAELILQGYNASVKPIKTHDEIWNRVWVGPFASEDAASKARARLAQKKLISIIIKVQI